MNADSPNGIAATITDTGQWKLVVYISECRLTAVLKNVSFPDVNPVLVLDKVFTAKPEDFLHEVESIFYDNPRLLDDFTTKIVIDTPRALWIPTSLIDDGDEFNTEFFTEIFPCAPKEIFLEVSDDVSCAFASADGLKSFLERTIPGCKIASTLSVLKEHFHAIELQPDLIGKKADEENALYVGVEGERAYIYAFSKGSLLCGTAHNWKDPADIAYFAYLAAKAYDINHNSTRIYALDFGKESADFKEIMGAGFNSVLLLEKPKLISENGLPLSVALA